MTAPIVAEAVRFAGGLIVCVLPLVVVIYLLRSLRGNNDDTDSAMVELMVSEIVSGEPRLLPSPTQPPALPSASSESDDASSIIS